MLFGQHISETFFFFLKVFAAYVSRAQFSPNSLYRNFYFAWLLAATC